MAILNPKNLETFEFQQFYLAIADRCNLKCIMCTTTTHPHDSNHELSLDEWKAVIENVTRFKVQSIGFGGGEPLLRAQELSEMVKMVAAKGITINIITNATLLTREFLQSILQYKEKTIFILSLDGLEPENDRIRGAGVFAKVMQAADLLKEYDWTFYFTSVLMPENFFSFIDFIKFLEKNYPQVPIDIQPVIPHNEIYYLRNKFNFSAEQLKALKDTLDYLLNNPTLKLSRPAGIISRYLNYFTNTLQRNSQCKMGTQSFNINLRGNLWICGKELEYPLHKYKLEEVLGSSEYAREMERVQSCQSPCLAGLVV
jgi:sulfatase maturation enzyme AslB (radical SAM superfamily)